MVTKSMPEAGSIWAIAGESRQQLAKTATDAASVRVVERTELYPEPIHETPEVSARNLDSSIRNMPPIPCRASKMGTWLCKFVPGRDVGLTGRRGCRDLR